MRELLQHIRKRLLSATIVKRSPHGRQCTKQKRPRNYAWFKENMLLAEALESGVVLDEEQIAFLVDNKDTITTGQTSQELATITAFQTHDLDAFDSNYDEEPSASVVLIAKLYAYDSDVFQSPMREVIVDRNAKESKEKEDKYLEEIIVLEKKKEALDNVVYKIVTLGYQNPLYMSQAQRKVPVLYYGQTIVKKPDALFVMDIQERLILAEEAQLQAKNNRKLIDQIATLKGKSMPECDKSENISKVITPGMYKLDLEPFSPKLLQNREAHVDYLKHTQEHANTLREIVEQAKALKPLDSDLD
uniref:Retrovirus-related Pol polyprotein from transposon TNT 1-94 n=1 Tax=Tanacetum cinerariifolium TaxID=118510 RepID=A0A699IE39_TANCI|nr:hypothetical protein [Tanacetum cinerariifolium]